VTGGVRIAFVVAVAENGVIGRAGQLPWRLPSDLKQFRKLTLGKPIIMGRKTYRSIGKPLDQRDTIVMTRGAESYPEGVRVAASLQEALSVGRTLARLRAVEEIMIIGGAEVFRAALPFAEVIYLTLVHATPTGDTILCAFSTETWREVARRSMPMGVGDEFAADFIILERRGGLPPSGPDANPG
jgi:dihydrofolate reductase